MIEPITTPRLRDEPTDLPDPRFARPFATARALGRWFQGQATAIARTIADNACLRVCLLAIGHSVLFLAAYWAAFNLRFDFAVPPAAVSTFCETLPWLLVIKLSIFYAAGQFHGWWRYVTFADLRSLLAASIVCLGGLVAIGFLGAPLRIPRSILILDCVVMVVMIGSLRASWRLVREQFWPMFQHPDCRRTLLVGADHATGLLAHQIQTHPHSRHRIVGFLDPDGARVGSNLGGIPVLGAPRSVRAIAAEHQITDVLVIAGSFPGKELRRLMESCDQAGLALKIIPGASNLFEGSREIPIRNIDINDLLRRDPVTLDNEAIAGLVKGRTVMVTGAGGSIGSEICRQLLPFEPRVMVLLGKGENRIFHIERELQPLAKDTILYPTIADISDSKRMRRVFEEFKPDVVFHAAAHKHVPLMESNVGEAVKNNVCGTRCVADLADSFGIQSFVLISSDKAVYPANVMGATKHLAERYVLALAEHSATRFIVTRFGNVLGSTGSVVPIFQEQIRHGGPITITDPRMTRYFMTIPEASQLVLQAAAMGRGGEIFVLHMGEPVTIVDLAGDLIRLSGLPEDSIEIVFTGIRPGEKLSEELYAGDEATLPTSHRKLRAAQRRPENLARISEAIDELVPLADGQRDAIRRKIFDILSDLESAGEGADEPLELFSEPLVPLESAGAAGSEHPRGKNKQ